ncbi:MAG TPA: CPBP family intramembrane glutamic endopeptidase [Chlamydiales bacterium]|nr:CPBP family intramembrane glutamic endopeptidase [Chlamydiales bacterium]
MKHLFAILCVSSLLYGADEIPFEETPSQELAALDFIQPPLTQQEMQLPRPAIDLPRKNPALAASLSFLLPGLGHVYLGDVKTASALIGTTGLGIGGALYRHSKSVQVSSLLAIQTTWSYGVYAAYRDARLYNGQSGYSYKMPTDSFADLTSAPFRPSVLKKPEVWGGLLGALALAVGTTYFAFPEKAHIQPTLSSKMALAPLAAFPVGLGEESLFRGYLQSQLSEVFTPWGGIVLSSLAFGAMHIPNALILEPDQRRNYYTFSIPFITALGAYFGWLTYKNHSLKESVALHTWYDFVLFAGSYLASKAAIAERTEFALALPF